MKAKMTVNLELSDKCKKELSDRIYKGVIKALSKKPKRRKNEK